MGRTISIRGKAAGDFARMWRDANREETASTEAAVMSPKLVRLVRRVAEGDCPRTTHKTFAELCETSSSLKGELQFESALGADTSGGFIITALHNLERTKNAAKAWLSLHDKPKPKKKTFARSRNDKRTLPPTGNRLYKRKKSKRTKKGPA